MMFNSSCVILTQKPDKVLLYYRKWHEYESPVVHAREKFVSSIIISIYFIECRVRVHCAMMSSLFVTSNLMQVMPS
jgi:hypothetical protein